MKTFKEKYFEIINKRMYEKVPIEQYSEKHHIVPKSICPLLSKSPDNIIRLTAFEHFMAHYYLWKWFDEEKYNSHWVSKMISAIIKMSRCREIAQSTIDDDKMIILAKAFEESRIKQSQILIKKFKCEKERLRISEIQKSHYKTHPERGKRHSKFMSDYWNKSNRNPSLEMKEYCRQHPEKQKKQSESMKKHYESKEARELTGRLAKEYYKNEIHKKESREYMRCRFTAVDQYTKDGEFIRTFECVQDAANSIGIKAPNIFCCISGKQHTSGGYVWRKHNS